MAAFQSPSSRFVGLDGLRGIAAIAVVIGHVFHPVTIIASFYLAVDFFFLLSGFVIARAYEDRLRTDLSLAQFTRIRFIRLYPLYFLAGAIALAWATLSLAAGRATPFDYLAKLANMVLLPLPIGDTFHLMPLNFPAWSLLCEALVNLLYAALILWLRPIGAVLLMAAIGLAGLVWTTVALGTIDAGVHWADALGGLARVQFSFFVGVALFRLHARQGHGAAAGTRGPARGVRAVAAAVLLVIALCITSRADTQLYEMLTVVMVFPLVIEIAAMAEPAGAWQGLFAFLGAISYPLYVIHIPLFRIFESVMERLVGGLSDGNRVAFITLTIAAAYLLDRLYDRPTRRWLNRAMPGARPSSALATARRA